MGLFDLIQNVFFGVILLALFGIVVFILNIVLDAMNMNAGLNNYGFYAVAVILAIGGIYFILRPLIGGN